MVIKHGDPEQSFVETTDDLLRREYWELLIDLSDFFLMPEALQAAKEVTTNEKRSLIEREEALRFLLTYQIILHQTEGEKEDEEIDVIIETLRDSPPSQDFLFLILNHRVKCGTIDEMTAFFELDDWREAHGE